MKNRIYCRKVGSGQAIAVAGHVTMLPRQRTVNTDAERFASEVADRVTECAIENATCSSI